MDTDDLCPPSDLPVIAKSAPTPGSADLRGAATRRWQLTDA
jgi:hypothetical protein